MFIRFSVELYIMEAQLPSIHIDENNEDNIVMDISVSGNIDLDYLDNQLLQPIENPTIDIIVTKNNRLLFHCIDIASIVHDTKKYIVNSLSYQDNIQKMIVSCDVCIQFYRILMGSLLLSFVPQKCGNHICEITENLYTSDGYMIVYILNYMTFLSFSLFYLVEIKRENRLITYLDVNTIKPNDANSVEIALRQLPDNKRDNIIFINKIYQQAGWSLIGIYLFNTVLSAIVIYSNYLDNKTITAFFTNVLFMSMKIKDVYAITTSENNIFYSAYMTNRLQFNDIDPDKIADGSIGINDIEYSDTQTEY